MPVAGASVLGCGRERARRVRVMKRARAIGLVEQMLQRLEEDQGWPLVLVQQVWLFGSFSRGASDPHDVDVAVRFERDERITQTVVAAIMGGGGHPYAPLRRALAGTSRGLQFLYEDREREQLQAEGAVMVPLWQRGDTPAKALAALHAITEDPEAGRAERHDMIDAFAGLDQHIPRGVRTELISWQDQGFITVERIQLADVAPDALPQGLKPRWIDRRWSPDSPLRRAAVAGLAHLHSLGASWDDVDLAGERLPTDTRRAGVDADARWWVNWKWQRFTQIPYAVTNGSAWIEIEVVHPTQHPPAQRPAGPPRRQGRSLPQLTVTERTGRGRRTSATHVSPRASTGLASSFATSANLQSASASRARGSPPDRARLSGGPRGRSPRLGPACPARTGSKRGRWCSPSCPLCPSGSSVPRFPRPAD